MKVASIRGFGRLLSIALASLAAGGGSAQAHHAASLQYDVEKQVTFDLVLTKVEWINPHSYLQGVRTVDGMPENWAIETAGTAAMHRMGLSNKDMFKVGSSYKVTVNPSRNGAKQALLTAVVFPDGRIFRLGAEAVK